ncbi:MAG: TolC family outer membrane protein [Legionellales bacterium]
MKHSLLFCMLILGLLKNSVAADLMDIYQQALDNDTRFKMAYDKYMSSSEAIPQARAALYPQLTLGAQTGQFLYNVKSPDFVANTYYATNVWQVTASQALFNYQAWAKVSQAKATVKAAQATFNDAAQDLILRTAKAYFDVLFSKDTLRFAQAKKRANKRQFDQATQRFNVGIDTITSVYEAKAAYDQSIAQVISARNNQENQSENLRKLTNHVYQSVDPLRDSKIPLIKPEPNKVEQWVDTGLKQNYKLYAAKYNLEVAKENIKAFSSGNWPVFSIQTNAVQAHNAAPNNNYYVQSKQTQAGVALAMNFPIFQGGLVQSQTRQAQFDYQTSSETLEQSYRDIVVNSRIAFNTIKDGISKVKADKQTVISQQNSLESTEAQFEAGTRTMVDVVNAQQRLFEAQEQLAQDQYNLINATLNLKYLAGTLNVNDIELVNSWLATTRVNGLPPVMSKASK